MAFSFRRFLVQRRYRRAFDLVNDLTPIRPISWYFSSWLCRQRWHRGWSPICFLAIV